MGYFVSKKTILQERGNMSNERRDFFEEATLRTYSFSIFVSIALLDEANNS
jgi:hypothetical protein